MDYNDYKKELINYRQITNFNLLKSWNPKDELYKKVNKDGNYADFKGDTIIFFLKENEKRFIKEIQKKLYENLGKILANALNKEFFHITLHDLCNLNITNNVERCIRNNKSMIKGIFQEIKDFSPIKLDSIGLYNGGSAIGVMFVPNSKEDFIKIFELRRKFDKLIPQNSLYIPHVTLGYYLPKEYSKKDRKEIFDYIQNTKINFSIELTYELLKYTIFRNMNSYIPVYPI
ncbi:hypothetical protein XJ44_09035 [Thermosipho affectus]|uniref:2'-5' RNA ligase family protein n=1 Tax=Thermosipho affectus TaxID=660294 RepID=A0ABX3IF51_9BACT|nr:hypothetical protein [Thermosipho affectus]ONN26451.1 hypothetical protein XJ44_09035 [Thermosipho affectus]